MKKLFELPIYALSESALKKRSREYSLRFRENLSRYDSSEENIDYCIDRQTFPQRIWDFNHIIGFIVISATSQDVLFDVFLPYPEKKRYRWLAYKKVFLHNIMANGTHFYVDTKYENDYIYKRTLDMLDFVIECHIPPRYYVDRTTFDNTSAYTDFKSIIRGVQEENYNGKNENGDT